MRWGERLLLRMVRSCSYAVTPPPSPAWRVRKQHPPRLRDRRSARRRNADDAIIPASLTKMMTLYLTFGALSPGQLDLSSLLKVSIRAAAMPPTKLGPGRATRSVSRMRSWGW